MIKRKELRTNFIQTTHTHSTKTHTRVCVCVSVPTSTHPLSRRRRWTRDRKRCVQLNDSYHRITKRRNKSHYISFTFPLQRNLRPVSHVARLTIGIDFEVDAISQISQIHFNPHVLLVTAKSVVAQTSGFRQVSATRRWEVVNPTWNSVREHSHYKTS